LAGFPAWLSAGWMESGWVNSALAGRNLDGLALSLLDFIVFGV